jgi:cellobiose phosphorylase
VELASEVFFLLDTLSKPVDYDAVAKKNQHLNKYFKLCAHFLTGEKVFVNIEKLSSDLQAKSDWLYDHIHKHEWVIDSGGYGWFNGYYDNNSERVEGEFPTGIRMILTSQVFTMMSGIADQSQANEIIRSVERYLFDDSVGGYRLNTDFKEVMLSLGRGFGFAYGHKENGAMFSHMAIMYAFALYRRGFADQGYKVLENIFTYCQDFSRCRMYPGIPEYVNQRGRGMYPYLTGSASWYLLTLITEAFGIKGRMGDLTIEPKLVQKQFDFTGKASITTKFCGKKLEITYKNILRKNFGEYRIISAYLDGTPIEFSPSKIIVPQDVIERIDQNKLHHIEVELGIYQE